MTIIKNISKSIFILGVSKSDTEDIKKLNADVLLLMGDIETGCKLVDTQVQHGESLYWQKALFICQLMNGETARAALTLSLLREQNDDLDTGFL